MSIHGLYYYDTSCLSITSQIHIHIQTQVICFFLGNLDPLGTRVQHLSKFFPTKSNARTIERLCYRSSYTGNVRIQAYDIGIFGLLLLQGQHF